MGFYISERLDADFPLFALGTSGVDIFFVISGFVMVVATASGRHHVSPLAFGLKRIVRVMPLYWVATTINLVVLIALPAAVLHDELDLASIARSYLLIPSANIDGDIAPLLGVGWTLYFEMFFYLLVAISVALKARPIYFVSPILLVCYAASFWRQESWPPETVFLSPLVLYFLFGMIMGEIATRSVRGLRLLGLACIPILIATSSLIAVGLPVSFKGTSALGTAFVVSLTAVVASLSVIDGIKYPPWLLTLGAASYSLYLFHPIVGPAVAEGFALAGSELSWIALATGVLACTAASIFIYRILELPLTRRGYSWAQRVTSPERNGGARAVN